MAESRGVKLAKRFGCVGFAIGFVGPFLFYVSPPSFFAYESHVLCPWCPYIDIAFGNAWTSVVVGLTCGFFCGLVLALVAFALGYMLSRFAQRRPAI